MSTDDKAKEVSAESASTEPITPAADHPDSATGENAGGPIILFFLLGFAASLIVGWVVFPKLLYSQKRQPVEFNHALHNEEVDDDCESCHFFREDGTYSGVPKLAQCIDCHEEVLGESPEEKKFVEEYVAKDREVPWLVYAKQPDCVFFSHVAHVKAGQMECVTCHGDIGESESLKPYEENRISTYSRDIWGKSMAGFTRNPEKRMKMDVCADCHRRENVNQGSVQTQRGGCFVCHK